MLKVVVTALVFTGGVLGGQAGPVPNAHAPEIVAIGRGDTTIAPTSAVFSVSVTTRAPTAGRAAADNAARLESTLRALRAVGLAATDITTAGYSVGQNYEEVRDRPPRPAGFVARNTLRVEVRRLEDVGRVIDAALAGGATEISAPQFVSSNTKEARRAALAEALREARADADAIARAAGGTLGRLIAANSGVSSPMYREYGEVMLSSRVISGAPTDIMPRDLTISANVTVRWEFVPGPSR